MPDLTQPLHPALDQIRADQLARWQTGQRILVEELLAGEPGPIDDEALLDLLYGEVLLREEHGERPQLAEYQRRFPRLAEPLRRQFELHQALESLPQNEASELDSAADPSTERDTSLDNGHRRDAPSEMPLKIGQYEVLEEIGRGGMGIVYKARHVLLPDRIVALKVIRDSHDPDVEGLKRRSAIEALAVAHLDHPNIVRLYEVTVAEINGDRDADRRS